MSEAERLCDQILILEKGKIIQQGNISDILKKNKKDNLEEVYFNLFNK